jgi:hypothetical protein
MDQGRDDRPEFDNDDWLRRLTHAHNLLQRVVTPGTQPDTLYANGRALHMGFELMHSEPDLGPPVDNPLLAPEMSDSNERDFGVAMLANYTLQEILNAWNHLDATVRGRLTATADVHLDFDHAVARMQAYYNGNDIATSSQMAEIVTIDLIGGHSDGVVINKVEVRSLQEKLRVFMLGRNDTIYGGFTDNAGQHPLVHECAEVIGHGTILISMLDAEFDDEEQLDRALLDVYTSSSGIVPRDKLEALLQRVREASLLAKERQALKYIRPTDDEITFVTTFLGTLPHEE